MGALAFDSLLFDDIFYPGNDKPGGGFAGTDSLLPLLEIQQRHIADIGIDYHVGFGDFNR
jgi:hypothetical protein